MVTWLSTLIGEKCLLPQVRNSLDEQPSPYLAPALTVEGKHYQGKATIVLTYYTDAEATSRQSIRIITLVYQRPLF
jgi:hypothetical protein